MSYINSLPGTLSKFLVTKIKCGTVKRKVLLVVVKKSVEELWALQRISRHQTPMLGALGTKAKFKTDLLPLFDRRVQYYDQQIFQICKLKIKLHARNIDVTFFSCLLCHQHSPAYCFSASNFLLSSFLHDKQV